MINDRFMPLIWGLWIGCDNYLRMIADEFVSFVVGAPFFLQSQSHGTLPRVDIMGPSRTVVYARCEPFLPFPTQRPVLLTVANYIPVLRIACRCDRRWLGV